MFDLPGPVVRECVEGYLFSEPPLELLLFRRTPERDRIWCPVQGKAESTDASLRSALVREVREETGFVARADELIDLDWHVPFRAPNGQVWRLHAFGIRVPRDFRPVLNEEHEAAEWVTAAEAARRLHFQDNRAAVERLRERLARPDPRPSPNV